MSRFVLAADAALHVASSEISIADAHQLLAPTLLRSQVLSQLYRTVARGEITKKEADRRLDYLRSLRIRFLGDRVLQQVAWKIADQLGWPDTLNAEYVALTVLQADAFVTLDRRLAREAMRIVSTAPVDALSDWGPAR
jgi:predicted nucleic acid-binding protein